MPDEDDEQEYESQAHADQVERDSGGKHPGAPAQDEAEATERGSGKIED